jgi:hypothetical protein
MISIDSVVLINRQKIQIVNNGKIFTLETPETIIKDLEVANKKSLFIEIKSFVEKNKITLGSVAVVLSEKICFTADVTQEGFLASLPFESPIGIVIGTKNIATNEDLFNSYVEGINESGGEIKTVSPLFIAPEMVGKIELDIPIAKFVISNIDFYLRNSFSYDKKIKVKNEVKNDTNKPTRTLILIGIFVFLAVILVVIIAARFIH